MRDVVAAADMVEIVSGRTQLRRSGSRWTGRCPFHEERTPSFSVNAADKLFHCFGCQKGGDVIDFVRETEQLDFAQAVEWLAERCRVQLEYEESTPQLDAARARRDRLLALLDQAAIFYERCLWDSEAGAGAREYLAGRGLRPEVCREYRLGLAPSSPGLAQRAQGRGFTLAELAATGLANKRGNDYFPSGRLMFPLADARGRVLGFGARRMRDDDPLRGKYVNSAEGELFHKSDIVYGLHRARVAIAKQDRALIVEGYTDVLALHQAGIEPVVASMGTALTEGQLQKLSSLTRRLELCFDADAAGEAATLRGMELAATRGFDVRVVPLEPGLDPADAADGFQARVERAEPYDIHRVRLEIAQARDRSDAYLRVQAFLNRRPESPERQEAWRLANDRLGITVQLQSVGGATGVSATAASPKLLEAGDRLERDVLAACVAHPELQRMLAEITPEHFDSDANRRLQERLVAGDVLADEELRPEVAELDARAAAGGIDEETGKELLLRLRERHVRRELAAAGEGRTLELQDQLRKIHAAIEQLAWLQSSSRIPR